MDRRIRYTTEGRQLVGHVEERKGWRWRPTGARGVVNLDQAERALRRHEARNPTTAGDTAGFGDRAKKFAKTVAKTKAAKILIKANVAPLKFAHKITHGKNSPIRKAELKLQEAVGKALPFTRPFIAVHNKLAGATHKTLETAFAGKGAKAAIKAGVKGGKGLVSAETLSLAASAVGSGGAAAGQLVSTLTEARKRAAATAIADQLKKVKPEARPAARKALVQQVTSWQVTSPKTGITYNIKI